MEERARPSRRWDSTRSIGSHHQKKKRGRIGWLCRDNSVESNSLSKLLS